MEPGESAPPHVVQVMRVSKSYEQGELRAPVLRDVDLTIVAGEFVALMGPSGSGKSTLLNLIAGLDIPDRGFISVAGQDLSRLTDDQLADFRLHSIGFVFQASNLIPALKVGENVALPLEFAGMGRTTIDTLTEKALRRVGMLAHAKRYPHTLAGGEQQRVAIARAIVHKPTLLLADELTGSLDSRTGRSILDLLRELNAIDHMSILMVTHNVFAASYGHRTLQMRDGALLEAASGSLPVDQAMKDEGDG